MLEKATQFVPEPSTQHALRRALGHFATGVTIVTAPSEIGPLGFTANSFSSVSLSPPLVQWSLARASKRHDAFATATHFAIHILGADQTELAARFATQGQAFDQVAWHEDARNVPILDHCIARLDCTLFKTYPAGDHSLILGEVQNVAVSGGAGLIFDQGRYGRFAPSDG